MRCTLTTFTQPCLSEPTPEAIREVSQAGRLLHASRALTRGIVGSMMGHEWKSEVSDAIECWEAGKAGPQSPRETRAG